MQDLSTLRVWLWNEEIWVAADTEEAAKEILEGELGELDIEIDDVRFTELKLTSTIEYSFSICGDTGVYGDDEEDGGSQVFTFSELINYHGSRGMEFPSIIARTADYC